MSQYPPSTLLNCIPMSPCRWCAQMACQLMNERARQLPHSAGMFVLACTVLRISSS